MTDSPVQPGPSKRIKIFTVHGTFDHEAAWDNWDDLDTSEKPAKKRHFINRLRERLSEHNVTLEKEDHTEFNWSGGNSHDERRIAAIGLKREIESNFSASLEKHGKDYYDGGLFVIGHSHGGTVARLAMNLWDKNHAYHLPPDGVEHDTELKADDRCPVCMRSRYAKFDPSIISKPTGIITFGSPFIHFKKRKAGLLSARIFVWVVRCLSLLPLAAFYMIFNRSDGAKFLQNVSLPYVSSAVTLLWPLAAFWFVALYLPRLILRPKAGNAKQGNVERGNLVKVFSLASWGVYLAGLLFLGVYYLAYYLGDWGKVLEWLPVLNNTWFWYLLPVFLFGLFAVTLPSQLLSWMEGKVEGLREKLPKKV